MVWPTILLLLVVMPLGAQAAPGGSVFEQVAVKDNAVIWPLDALLEHIARQLAGGRNGMRTVLIPVGRSLQRHAAGDAHYFDSPRAVIAITGEPVSATAPLLKDRLYLGHHAAAGVLEVISYHEGSGRFEFFIVDDYRAGGTPHLRAGNRGMCLACHQNDAPIFSRPNWDETSANPIIARLLASTGKNYDHLDRDKIWNSSSITDHPYGRQKAMLELGLINSFNDLNNHPSDDYIIKQAGVTAEEYHQRLHRSRGHRPQHSNRIEWQAC